MYSLKVVTDFLGRTQKALKKKTLKINKIDFIQN